MAKRTAKKKAAGDGSSPTFEEVGFTTQLRDLLRAGNRTGPSQTQWSSRRSPTPNSPLENESSSTSAGEQRTLITVRLPDGNIVQLAAKECVLELDRDSVDVTSWRSVDKVYAVGGGTFSIKGRL